MEKDNDASRRTALRSLPHSFPGPGPLTQDMPSTMPSNDKKRSRNTKKKSGTASNRKRLDPEEHRIDANNDDDDDDDELERRAREEFLAAVSFGKFAAQTETFRTSAANARRDHTTPDAPPCDNCSKPFWGSMQCSRCESVFYCDRSCQVAHWTASHKHQCAATKQKNDEIAKDVIENFTTNVQDWRALDFAGVYKAAVHVHHGLHDKIREVMHLDLTTIAHHDRIRSWNIGSFFLYTPHVMKVLFRGQRAEGRRADNADDYFNCYDGVRVRDYVKSHPDALESWLQVSFELVKAAALRVSLWRLPDLHRKLHDVAHDVWSGWAVVFASPTASRAVLLSRSVTVPGRAADNKGKSKASEDHIRKLASRLGDANRVIVDLPFLVDDIDDVNQLFKDVCVATAMVHLRVQMYKNGVNVEEILNFKGILNQKFRGMAIPVAKRTIELGRELDPVETFEVITSIDTTAGSS